MGNSKSSRKKEPTTFFGREKQIEYERERQAKTGRGSSVGGGGAGGAPRGSGGPRAPPPVPARLRPEQPPMSYDQEAIERMRHQLRTDANAFLLNNIMLSVQFFENYERVIWDLKNNSVTDADVELNNMMAQHHKHVFLPDKLQESANTDVLFCPLTSTPLTVRPPLEALQPQRMFVIHDNVEVNEPGDVSEYYTVMDAPFYRMLLEDSDEPGYVKLKKLEILENITNRDNPSNDLNSPKETGYSSDADGESIESDIKKKDSKEDVTEGENFMLALKEQIAKPSKPAFTRVPENLVQSEAAVNKHNQFGPSNQKVTVREETSDFKTERRPSGILKSSNKAVKHGALVHSETRQKKVRTRQTANKVSPNGSESSGYKSSYSPQTESSGTESDYGYATITAETTPRKLEASQSAKFTDSTSVIPSRCISVVEVKKKPNSNMDEEDEIDEAYSARYRSDFNRELYKKIYYLNSHLFMRNFSDLFLMRLAESLGFSTECVREALTQGASIYCNKGYNSYEVLPAVNTTWPSAARGWLTRARNIISSPRTNYKYQWPTPYMVGKAQSFGCLIVPVGFRPTRGPNPEQTLQWRLTFPAVERYLETCLAHSQVRCYMFTQLLFKTYIKNDQSKAGIDYSHLRNHLFWQCEDNYAQWPEDRLGETLRLFLKSFYQFIMKGKMRDYFIPQCNLLKGIPKTVLLKQQRMLADIIESPVMHLLSSLHNLKYTGPDFYPVMNYLKLYRILTSENVMKLINPNLPKITNTVVDDDDSDREEHQGKSFWDEMKVKDPGYQWKVNNQRQQNAKKAAESLYEKRKVKSEKYPINRKFTLPAYLDANKKMLVLEMFIPHFIAMADCSDRFEATKQGMIYLEHAHRLSILLQDDQSSIGQARAYISEIKEKIEVLRSKVAKSGAPKVPKRNESFNGGSIRPGGSGVKKPKTEQYVNISNINKIVNDEIKITVPVSPTTKMASIILADVHQVNERPRFIKAISFQKVEEESEEGSEEGSVNESENESEDDVTVSRL